MTRAWLFALALAAACKEAEERPPAQGPVASASPSSEPDRVEKAAASGTKTAANDACRDWSELDVDTLAPLPDSTYAEALDQVWTIVLQKHFDPTLSCLDWPALRAEYGGKLTEAKSRAEAYRLIDEMLQKLGQSHFRLFGAEPASAPQLRPAAPPLHVRFIEDKLVVVHSDAAGHLGEVPPGATVLAIEGTPASKIIEDVRARTHRPSELSFQLTRDVAAYLSCDRPGQTRKLRIADPTKGDAEAVRVVTCEAPEGELVTLGNLRDIPTRVEHRMIGDGPVGYLAFNVWMLPMVQQVKAAMKELRGKGMRALVLDLRGNPGGVGPMSVPVARMILDEPASLGALKFRDFTQEFNVEPDPDPFRGPVAILVDAGTASTSEIFAQGLRDLGRISVVGGEPSAGAALPSLIEELPGGAVLQYVVGEYVSPEGVAVEGKGVVPDVQVTERRSDFAAGRDPVLDAAVKHLGEKLGGAPQGE